ncbi:MAG TPA: hypothetical protein H9866_07745 [Candidatus Tidjanibacter gallistercoris]|nr:hypothetical protein [Candidatus Tidjanibacter gallistercoris]
MMNSLKLRLFLVTAAVFGGGQAFAQNVQLGPEWGENATQEQRFENATIFNFYRDAYNTQNYDKALTYLPKLIENSPRGAQNIYVYAINIYKNKIQRSMDVKQRGVYVDSLFMLYDMRIQYFGDNARYGRPYILVQKAKDYLNFMPMDRDGVRRVFVEAIEANEDAPDVDFINIYFNELTTDYKNDLVETDDYLEQYEWLAGLLDKVTAPEADDAKATFDSLFVSSDAAGCDNIEKIFKARIEANPTDVTTLAKAFTLLLRSECHSPFMNEVGEMYYNADPTAETAKLVASAFVKTGDNAKAVAFLKAAFDKETDPLAKSMIAVEIAGTELGLKNASVAANYASQARQLDPSNGYAYIMLAQAYAEGATACEGFDRQTVYWLAYDILAAARPLFENGSAEQQQVDQTMSIFRSSFPSNDELFFRGLTAAGTPYDVKCGWITGRTTVKMVE